MSDSEILDETEERRQRIKAVIDKIRCRKSKKQPAQEASKKNMPPKSSKSSGSGRHQKYKLHIGWRHYMKGEYRQVTSRRGGGIRNIEYDVNEPQSVESLLKMGKDLFFPQGQHMFGNIDEMEVNLCTYSGEPINQFHDLKGEKCSFQQFLKSTGRYSSQFYVYLTTKNIEQAEPHKESKGRLLINGNDVPDIHLKFTKTKFSALTQTESYVTCHTKTQCFELSGLNDDNNDYNPLDDGYQISYLAVRDKVFIDRSSTSLVFPQDTVTDNNGFFFHGPSEIHGTTDGDIVLGVVTNCTEDVQYTWYKDKDVIAAGINLNIIYVSECGQYNAQCHVGELMYTFQDLTCITYSEQESTSTGSELTSLKTDLLPVDSNVETDLQANTTTTALPPTTKEYEQPSTYMWCENPPLSSETAVQATRRASGLQTKRVRSDLPCTNTDSVESSMQFDSDLLFTKSECYDMSPICESDKLSTRFQSDMPLTYIMSDQSSITSDSVLPLTRSESNLSITRSVSDYLPTTLSTSSVSDLPTTSSESDLPKSRREYDLPTTSSESDLPTTRRECDLHTTRIESDLPTTRIESDLPSTNSESDLPTSRREYDLPTTSSESDLPTTRREFDLHTTRIESDLPTTRIESDLPTTNSDSDLPTSRREYDLHTTSSESDLPTIRIESDLPTTRIESDLPTTRIESELPTTRIESDLLTTRREYEIPTTSSESDLPTARLEYDLSTTSSESSIPTNEAKALIKPTSEVEIDLKSICFENKIGEGSFGEVYKGTWIGTDVAVKKIKVKRMKYCKKLLLRELDVHNRIKHPNILLLMGFSLSKDHLYLISEHIDGLNLDDAIFGEGAQQMDLHTKHSISLKVSRAVAYLHNQTPEIIHRDIKPENILISQNADVVKLCDMGLSKLNTMHITLTTFANVNELQPGTPVYQAPEVVLLHEKATTRTDIWSFSCTLSELYAEEPVWDIEDDDFHLHLCKLMEKRERPHSLKIIEKEESLAPSSIVNIVKAGLAFERDTRPSALAFVSAFKSCCCMKSENSE